MKQNLLLGLLLIFTIKSFSQNSKFTVEISYPYTLNKTEKNDYTNGVEQKNIIDFGIKYSILKWNTSEFGVGINNSYLKTELNDIDKISNRNLHNNISIIQPKIFGKSKFTENSIVGILVGIGYSFETVKTDYLLYFSNVPAGQSNYRPGSNKSTDSGFNMNVGITLDITKRLFLQVQYDIIFYKQNEIYYNENLDFLKFGLGFKI